MQSEKRQPHFSIYLLASILLLLPLDSALSGLFGSVSLVDYIVVVFLVVHVSFNPNVIFRKNKLRVVFVLLSYAAISILWSRNCFSLSNIMYLSYLCLFIILVNTNFTLAEKKLLSNTIFCSVFLLITFTLIFGEFYHGRLSIDINGYIDPNYFCTGFVIIVAVLLCMIKNNNHKLISLICLVLLLTIVLLSGSRGALVALVAEIICYIIFLNRKHFVRMIFMIGFIFALCVMVYMVLPQELTSRFDLLESIKTDGGSGRLVIWKNMFAIYQNGSLLTKIFGYGRESCVVLYKNMVGINYTPHNVYIKVLLEFGIFGIALLAICLIYILKMTIKNGNGFLFAVLVGICFGAFFLDMGNTRVIWFILLFLCKQDLICVNYVAGGKERYVVKHSCASL